MEPTLPEESKSRPFTLVLLLILGGVTLGSSVLYLKTTYPSLFTDSVAKTKALLENLPQPFFTDPSPSPTPSPSPSTNKSPFTLPPGAQTYTFSHGDQVKGPRLKTITFDPLALNPGDKQTITLEAFYHTDITEVTIEMITDNQTTPLSLTRTDGNRTEGTWVVEWNVHDPTDYRYGARLILKSLADTYDNTMWFK